MYVMNDFIKFRFSVHELAEYDQNFLPATTYDL